MTPAPPAAELLYGIRAVAEFLGVTERQAYHLAYSRGLPHWKEGRSVVARRRTLMAWVDAREAAGRGGDATKPPAGP